jgi:hypothetical protein
MLLPVGTPQRSLISTVTIDATRTRNGSHAQLLKTPVNGPGFAINPAPLQELQGITLNRVTNPSLEV